MAWDRTNFFKTERAYNPRGSNEELDVQAKNITFPSVEEKEAWLKERQEVIIDCPRMNARIHRAHCGFRPECHRESKCENAQKWNLPSNVFKHESRTQTALGTDIDEFI